MGLRAFKEAKFNSFAGKSSAIRRPFSVLRVSVNCEAGESLMGSKWFGCASAH